MYLPILIWYYAFNIFKKIGQTLNSLTFKKIVIFIGTEVV
jgi:hypothetical protein